MNTQTSNKIIKGCNFSKESLIGGGYIDTKICDDIIKYFNTNKNKAHQGVYSKTSYIGKVKDSLDIKILNTNLSEPFKSYRTELQNQLNIYKDIYKIDDYLHYFELLHYNIQFYKKNQGYHKEHIENHGEGKYKDRCIVFMTYLNSLKDGGTIFRNQGITTVAEKGLTLFFPAYFTHIHKGQISSTSEKYIVTGWYSFEN